MQMLQDDEGLPRPLARMDLLCAAGGHDELLRVAGELVDILAW